MDIVYLITNKTKNKFYVGSKKNWEGEGSYWGSSKNEEFWEDFATDEFVFEVLFEVEPDPNEPKKLLREEIEEQVRRDVLKDPSYYNKHIPDVGFSTLGDKRPGVGGTKKGTIPWNKGKKGYTCKVNGQGNATKNQFVKRWKDEWNRFVSLYESRPPLEGEGTIQRNGRVIPYDRLFSKTFYQDFPVNTPEGLHRVIKNLDKHKELMDNV